MTKKKEELEEKADQIAADSEADTKPVDDSVPPPEELLELEEKHLSKKEKAALEEENARFNPPNTESEPKPLQGVSDVTSNVRFYGPHTIDFTDPKKVRVYGGPVHSDLGEVTYEQVVEWLDKQSWNS